MALSCRSLGDASSSELVRRLQGALSCATGVVNGLIALKLCGRPGVGGC